MPGTLKIIAPWLSAFVAGALVTLSLQPFGYWPLALASSAILFFLLAQSHYKKTLLLSLCFSIGLFFSGASWVYVSIHEFGNATAIFALLLTALFCLTLAVCNALILSSFALLKCERTELNILIFAAISTASEALRSWLFTGFPWLFIGYSQTETILSGLAPVLGVYSLSFIICASGATLIYCAQNRNRKKTVLTALLITFLVWLSCGALQQISWTQTKTTPLQVSMVQANISQHDKWRSEHFTPTLNLYAKMSAEHWRSSDLVLWPEAAIPAYKHNVLPYLDEIHDTAVEHKSALITGIPTAEPNMQFQLLSYNSVVGLGNASGTYHKQHLVPFGEYIPLQFIFGKLMAFFELPLSHMQAGGSDQTPLLVDHWHTLPLVCYEMVYPGLVANATKQSDVLITLSNDSWFGASLGPLQHLQMAQMRAIENGRYVLRSTGNGVSAVIDDKGKLLAKSKQFTRQVLTAKFELKQGQTPWTQYGYWLVHWLYGLPLFLRAAQLFFKRIRQ